MSKNRCGNPVCNPLPGRTECQRCRMQKWRMKNPVYATFVAIKYRAKQRGIIFQLTFEQFKKFCDDTGYMERKGTTPESLTIDRIKNSKGYTIDNIQVLTLSANVKKQRSGKGGWTHAAPREEGDPF